MNINTFCVFARVDLLREAHRGGSRYNESGTHTQKRIGVKRMPLLFVRNDITRMKVDAIVNAANSELREGGGVCGAIFEAAGAAELRKECAALAPCGVGQAILTDGHALPARHIIHTVGPVWQGGSSGEEGQLRACYANSLALAVSHKLTSIAFPLISSGIFGYPKEEAMRCAVAAIREVLLTHDLLVYLVFYDAETNLIGSQRYQDIARHIDDRYVQTHSHPREVRNRLPREPYPLRVESPARTAETDHVAYRIQENFSAPLMYPDPNTKKADVRRRSLADVVTQLEETFSECLLRHIDEKGLSDVTAYKRANIDRRLFSKIRSDKAHAPKKTTALAFAIALGLSLDETRDLLKKAGYALSNSSRFDIIVAFCIEEGLPDIDAVNEILFQFEEPLLGA